jgi:hypothetical protein
MTLPGLISPKYTDSFELFFCPAQSREHYFWKGLGHTGEPNDVGSSDWRRNVNWKRLWWSSWGSCYGVPMSIGSGAGWRAGTYLTQGTSWSYYGAVDLDSAGSNSESLYMADVDEYIDQMYLQNLGQEWPAGIHLYETRAISELHSKPNYLTFGGQVVSDKTKDWLVATCVAAASPWIFEWSSGPHAEGPALTPPNPTWAW